MKTLFVILFSIVQVTNESIITLQTQENTNRIVTILSIALITIIALLALSLSKSYQLKKKVNKLESQLEIDK